MAFGTKRVWAEDGALFLPSGHSVNTSAASIGTVDNVELGITFTIAASTSVTTTQAAGCDTLLKTDLVSAIDTYIGTTQGVDTTGNTVDYNAKVLAVVPSGGVANSISLDMYLNDATRNFDVTINLSVAIS